MRSFGPVEILGSHPAGVTSVRIASDGRRIFSSSLDGTVCEWPGGSALLEFPPVRLYHHAERVKPYCLNLAVNEEYLICGMQHGTVEVYALADGGLVRRLPNPIEKSAYQYNFHTVTSHPANPHIVAGSNGGYLVVWSAPEGEILWRETGFRLINTVRFLRQGKFLMAHEWDPWIHLWNFETPKRVRWDTSLMDTCANWVTACAAPPGSSLDFAIGTEDADESTAIGANVDLDEPSWQVSALARVHEMAFLPGGEQLLAGGGAGVLELWETVAHRPPRQLDLRAEPAVAARIKAVPTHRKSLIILTAPVLDESYPPWTIHCLDVAADGSFAVVGLANGLVLRVQIERTPP